LRNMDELEGLLKASGIKSILYVLFVQKQLYLLFEFSINKRYSRTDCSLLKRFAPFGLLKVIDL
jgi:hypothetical protein